MMYDLPMTQGRVLPRLTFREIDLPEVKTLEVGDKRYIVLKVEMIAKSSGQSLGLTMGNDGSKVEGEFQVLTTKMLGMEAVDAKSLESKEFNAVIAKIKSGEM